MPKGLPDFEQRVPHFRDRIVATDDFKSILARVTGARNQHARAAKWKPADLIFLQVGDRATRIAADGRARQALVNELLHPRALHGHGGVIVRGIADLQLRADR